MKKNQINRRQILHSILPYLPNVRIYIAKTQIISAVIMAIGFVSPLLYKLFIDEVVLGGEINKLSTVILGYIGLFIITASLNYVNRLIRLKYGNIIMVNMKSKIFDYYFSINFSEYESLNVGDVKMRIEDDVIKLRSFLDAQCIDIVIAYITAIIIIILLLRIDYRLACYSVFVIPITILVDRIISKKEKVLNEKSRVVDQDLSGWLQESIKGWREIRALGIQKRQERIYTRYLAKQAILFGRWINYWTARALVVPLIRDTLLFRFGLYFLGGLIMIKGDIMIGSVLVFAQYFITLSSSINTISSCNADMISNQPYYERVIKILSCNSNINKNILESCNEIIVDDVSYSYPNTNNEVINHVSLKIKKGDWIAIVGKSGVGKSTLIKLICGLIRPSSGRILFDGKDSVDMNIDTVFEKVGIILQDSVLYNGTIRDNLKYGKENATESEIQKACMLAGIKDMISKLPEGINTTIGDQGIRLSAGQKQRVVLARLFLKSPDVYIFDEATSNLDSYSWSAIIKVQCQTPKNVI